MTYTKQQTVSFGHSSFWIPESDWDLDMQRFYYQKRVALAINVLRPLKIRHNKNHRWVLKNNGLIGIADIQDLGIHATRQLLVAAIDGDEDYRSESLAYLATANLILEAPACLIVPEQYGRPFSELGIAHQVLSPIGRTKQLTELQLREISPDEWNESDSGRACLKNLSYLQTWQQNQKLAASLKSKSRRYKKGFEKV